MKTTLTLLLGIGLVFSQVSSSQTADTKPALKVSEMSPKTPAELALRQKVVVKVDFNNPGPDSVQIFVRPFTQGSKSNGYTAHASRAYPAGEGKVEGFFLFETAAQVDEVRVTMVDLKTNKEISVLKVPVDFKWK
jgi:hypothetical protein